MRGSTPQHKAYCGLDLHARRMYVCVRNQDGEILLHRHMPTRPEVFLTAIAPYRADLGVAVACSFPWSWLADLCAQDQIPFVLGHALDMQAIHGGKAKHDTSDAQQIAVLLRGGMLPQAAVSPAERRAPRDLRRRRLPLRRTRAALLAHIQPTHRQDTLPESGQTLASKGQRDGGAARCLAPAVQKSVEVDLALSDHDARLRSAVALTIGQTAKPPKAHALSRRHSVPGLGTLGRVGLRYALHALTRCPRVQDFVSSCRLGTGAKASAGQRDGTAGKKRGHASLTGALAEAAVLLLRHKAQGQQLLARVEHKHGQGTALTILAHQLARAVSDMVTRETVLEMDLFLNGSGSSAGKPAASLDTQGSRRNDCPWQSATTLRHGTRNRPEAFFSEPARWLGSPGWLLDIRGWSDKVHVCGPSPEPAPHWRTPPVQPRCGRGRYEGTAQFLGRREGRCPCSALTLPRVTAPHSVCGADTFGLLLRWKCSPHTLPKPDGTKGQTAEKS
jgi:hypothetical protein